MSKNRRFWRWFINSKNVNAAVINILGCSGSQVESAQFLHFTVASASSALVLLTDELLHIQRRLNLICRRFLLPSAAAQSAQPRGGRLTGVVFLWMLEANVSQRHCCFCLIGFVSLPEVSRIQRRLACEVLSIKENSSSFDTGFTPRTPQGAGNNTNRISTCFFVRFLMLLWQLDKSHDK